MVDGRMIGEWIIEGCMANSWMEGWWLEWLWLYNRKTDVYRHGRWVVDNGWGWVGDEWVHEGWVRG